MTKRKSFTVRRRTSRDSELCTPLQENAENASGRGDAPGQQRNRTASGNSVPGYQVPGTRAYARHKAWIRRPGEARRPRHRPFGRGSSRDLEGAGSSPESDAVSRKNHPQPKGDPLFDAERTVAIPSGEYNAGSITLQIARIQIARRYGLSRRLAKYLAELKASPYRRIVPPHRNYVPLQARYPQTNYQPLHPGAQQHYLQAAGLAGWGDTEEDEYGQIGLANLPSEKPRG